MKQIDFLPTFKIRISPCVQVKENFLFARQSMCTNQTKRFYATGKKVLLLVKQRVIATDQICLFIEKGVLLYKSNRKSS